MRYSFRNKTNRINFLLTIYFWLSCLLAVGGEFPLSKSFDIRTESTRPRMLKILVDTHGLIWAGTDVGVFTFDGINFSKIPDSEKAGSPVSALYEDKTGKVWVGHENGKILFIENYHAFKFNPEEGVPKTSISAFAQNEENNICFSTKGEGLYFFDQRLFNINTDDGLSDNYCYSMVKLPDGRMCVGTDAGINFVTFKNGKKTVTSIGPSEGLPDEIVRSLACDSNVLWIGLQDHGIAKYDLRNNKLDQVDLKQPWIYGPAGKILIVEEQLWITTESQGLKVLDRDGFIYPVNIKQTGDYKMSDIAIDRENNIWITVSLYLIRTTGKKLSLIEQVNGKKLDFIHCILSDTLGNIWFSPDQQLGKLSRVNGQLIYKEYKIVRKADIVTLYFDPYGYLWIGTLGEGVFRLNPVTGFVRKVTSEDDAEGSSILSINGLGNTVWVGGFNSVSKFRIESNGHTDYAEIRTIPVFEGSKLLSDYVYTVFIDSKEITWFGTDENGIFRLEGESLTNYPLPGNAIHAFTEDKKGRIWFATANAGIGYLGEQGELHRINTKEGLSDPTTTAITTLENGNLLIVHANGFDVYSPETGDIIYHSSEENLDNINVDLNSLTIAPDKTLWIGTEKGIIHYRPESDVKMRNPEVMLKSVSVFLKPVDLKIDNKFAADENNLSFNYMALWYADPQRLNYLFTLEGYSTKWEKTKDHLITFPKLPPGNYVFKIRSSINQNFSRSAETRFAFQISPPFWQTWWFRIIASGLIALLIMIIVKRREKRLRNFERLEKEKIKFQFETLKSQVNPHFLFNSFNTLISVIEDKPGLAIEYVEKLSEFFRNIVVYRDKNLVTLAEELILLDNYIFIQRKRYGENLKLEITIDEKTKHEMSVPPLTLQMLSENAIKHNAVSKESPLLISISVEGEMLIIKNNLNRKIAHEKSAGFGLENIKARYKLLTSEDIQIIKDDNNFQVIIPLIKTEDEYIDT